MKPLMVSTGDALSSTQAMSYFSRSLCSPVRYHWMSARSAFCIGRKRVGRRLQHELARGEVVVRAVVDPEVLRVALDLGEGRRIDPLRMRDDLIEDAAHLERPTMLLIDEDVASRNRRLIEM